MALVGKTVFKFFDCVSSCLGAIARISCGMVDIILLMCKLTGVMNGILTKGLLSVGTEHSVVVVPFTLLTSCVYLFFIKR